jgi:hypothetical protein
MLDKGTVTDRLVFSSWICWSIPLLVTEAFLQGRKVFAPAPASKTSTMEV